MTDREARLSGVLGRARELGFLGPGPIDVHIEHARGYASVVSAPTTVLDLGSGGGVPALVLAVAWPDARFVLVESNQRRRAHLVDAIEELGLQDRAEVLHERAEIVAREPQASGAVRPRHRPGFRRAGRNGRDRCRSGRFGRRRSVVSEPPDPRPERWPATPLRALGFSGPTFSTWKSAHFVHLRKVSPAPETAPRAVGRPTKRPLW